MISRVNQESLKSFDIPSAKPRSQQRFLPIITRRCPKMTLVLDLDETLIHSSFTYLSDPDQIIHLKGAIHVPVYVKYRPGLREFLSKVSTMFEVVLYTSSTKEYAEKVLTILDPERRFLKYRLYRDSCLCENGEYFKNLGQLGRNLAKVIIIDNSISAFASYLCNGIPIMTWIDDPKDNELYKAGLILERLINEDDVRPALNSMFNLPTIFAGYLK